MSEVTLEKVKTDAQVISFLEAANEYLGAIGYTEHGFRHADIVASLSRNILVHLNYKKPLPELASIAGYLHDIGNVVNRTDHIAASALIAMDILDKLGMPPENIAIITGAIGNHEEPVGEPVNPVAAALILADKADVHRNRVRNPQLIAMDIHDRVNYAVERSFLRVDSVKKKISLELTIDTKISQVMEYFEIFLSRMLICKKAAEYLKTDFDLYINETKLF
ncbi:MAG: phosphohydrolase [Elusimicrobia bacterium RIFOXYC2_FULL_34_12]|nr:MAG: phosphohydrolase [Elusimicrobia bacterium RIFOXYC2_FULL_34_12]OGS38884.1 MAG: phosphohydrolase [Elusimicrobia bacterium RIFOXYD2_FULL_34_30]HAM39043.1 phosphohydrolase [Elusimicrobiota bacterium]